MTREQLPEFQGRNNVTKIVADNGSISYLTQSVDFTTEAFTQGATRINTVETEKKHVLFLFNSQLAEVGRYYLGKKLQGLSLDDIIAKKAEMCVFESFNPATQSWVPCVGLNSQPNLASTSKAL
jgi:hypothetical protein